MLSPSLLNIATITAEAVAIEDDITPATMVKKLNYSLNKCLGKRKASSQSVAYSAYNTPL
ncbi:hypothetical protein PF010_g4324 [Phytophthora fragariae]|uniref:Uncharacterized protein n=1 Tax=Phytophthora fragariae TaxID=53985 RepID=A0A6A3SAX6_9STRA|nr:hypothetical protein PF007_g10766 [Phytophthora fragariae]KAE9128930.1 hypothetical protein PF010_g4324 [Phytophthora fragariae]KAE9154516.1 hypothetical protein PF006_g1451 [Phytophthora fragariae]KAE9253520.1 hypothetical protein PF004_g1478 [Phytophthora fragariae]KAE9327342.1 hypothetical protein PF001_g1980 [Phytophthora fragariae]